jgi:hypothetical protein
MLLIGENESTQVMVASYFNELRICEICKIKEMIFTKNLVELGKLHTGSFQVQSSHSRCRDLPRLQEREPMP